MSRQGENIYLRKDGRWEGRYIIRDADGCAVKFKYIYGKTADEVRSKTRIYIDSLHTDKRTLPKCELTVEQSLFVWLATKRDEIKSESCIDYEHRIKNHILPYFAGLPLAYLNVEILKRYVRHKINSGLKEKTVSVFLGIIKGTVNLADTYYYLPNASAILKLKIKDCLPPAADNRQT